MTKLYWGTSFAYKGLSVGVNASYIFGPLSRRIESVLHDGSDYSSYLLDIENNKVGDFHLRYGIQYNDSIFKKYSFTLGAFFENKTELNSDILKFTSRTIVRGTDITIVDTLSANLQLLEKAFNKISINHTSGQIETDNETKSTKIGGVTIININIDNILEIKSIISDIRNFIIGKS